MPLCRIFWPSCAAVRRKLRCWKPRAPCYEAVLKSLGSTLTFLHGLSENVTKYRVPCMGVFVDSRELSLVRILYLPSAADWRYLS